MNHSFRLFFSSIVGLIFTIGAAHSQTGANPRAFVSGLGADTGSCGRGSPCRTFAYAMTQTSPGGEVYVLDSGEYGPFTISASVSVVNEGHTATVTATSGNAISINGDGTNHVVRLQGLSIAGRGTASTGIYGNIPDGAIEIANSTIQDFVDYGVYTSNINILNFVMLDSSISRSGKGLVLYTPPTAGSDIYGTIKRSLFSGNGVGVVLYNSSSLDMEEGGIVGGTGKAAVVAGAGLSVHDVMISGNQAGLTTDYSGGYRQQSGTIYASRSAIFGNAGVGIDATRGIVYSYGDNYVDQNGTDVLGNLTPVTRR